MCHGRALKILIHFFIYRINIWEYTNNNKGIDIEGLKKGGVMDMKANKSIGCTVNECRYHAKNESFCSLDNINVVKHTNKATNKEATDCGSFEAE